MILNGAEVLVRSLAAAGVECVFMIEHPETAAIASALMKSNRPRLISPVSELSCAPMADGYIRRSGRPAAAITAGGGHVLNQLVGVTSAWADKSPVISIGLRRPSAKISSPIFDREDWDPAAAFTAVTRFTATIHAAAEIPSVISRALREAWSGRNGPVHLELESAALEEKAEFSEAEEKTIFRASFLPSRQAPPRGEPEKVEAAARLLQSAKRPLVLAGGGVIKSEAAALLNELAAKLGAPITSTMAGMGAAFPDNPSYLGPASYLSGEAFHAAIKQADVCLAMGCCFSGLDGLGLPPIWSGTIKFIQVNLDPEDLAINPPAEIAIVGDAKQVARQLLEAIGDYRPPSERAAWLAYLRGQNQAHRDRIVDEAGRPWPLIHPALAPLALAEVAGDSEALMVLDGGNTALWNGMLMPVPGPRRGFFPVGMGTLGLGLPSALGVKLAAPEKTVALVTGDGAFLYNVHELETMRKYNLPLVIIIHNDSAWNMIRAGQAMSGKVYGTDLPGQDYAAVARCYGLPGKRVTRKEELVPAFREALAANTAAVIDVVVDPDTIPDSLVSFARVEFAGAKTPPGKLIGMLKNGKFNLDLRGWNLIKFIRKTM